MNVYLLHLPVERDGKAFSYELKSGTNLQMMLRDLRKQEVISSQLQYALFKKGKPVATQLKAGKYFFEKNIIVENFLKKIVRGKTVSHSITLIEGWTLKQVLQQLALNPFLKHELISLDIKNVSKQLGISRNNPEGLFLPDTYQFDEKNTDISLLKRAYDLMQQYLQNVWKDRAKNLPYKNAYQALIVASLIEKETALKEERPIVSDIILKRWQKRMPLQIDPTVIYGLGDKYKGYLTRRHLRMKTPYNTYRRYGLPPTPIAMPSRSSILAALHPDKTPYWYFVAKSGGAHEFSATLAEQRRAVKNYRQLKYYANWLVDDNIHYYIYLLVKVFI